MKMVKTDIGVVAVFYAICAFFYVQTQKLSAESQTYPTFIIAILFGLTTLYLLQMVFRAKKYGTVNSNGEFKDFQPLQFFGCLALTILYLLGVHFIGFYVSSAVFMVATLLFLKVKPIPVAISTVAVLLLVYVAFTRFLQVRLPAGLLF
ncbi:MAG: tripartite tricarboxylate transporter TctB family protein [Lachnospiraceae bacterium]|nr:tripartite tricarboxylate transporter TctB family protein [Lachnospiraceae bacterium]MBR4209166.1 tripartite tricarboxylate transporter TctB family protein [Lachnospiraceae bacterium]MBR4250414.1 tripartite tricarboxylate transporter TctB family protein [Verrucomicrobiota bacterium]